MTQKIGVIGAGSIGASIGYLVRDADLKLAFRGSARSQALLKSLGLSRYATTDVQSVLDTSEIIFLSVKPQDFSSLRNLRWPQQCLYVNMMAAVPFSELERTTGCKMGISLFHLHTGPHDLLRAGKGVGKIFPAFLPDESRTGDIVLQLCKKMNIELLPPFESAEEVAVFGTLVCAPMLFTMMRAEGKSIDEDVSGCFQAFAKTLGASQAMAEWAFTWGMRRLEDMQWENLPQEVQQKYTHGISEYVWSLATQGGITEAIFKAFQQGKSVDVALLDGHNRYLELLEKHKSNN